MKKVFLWTELLFLFLILPFYIAQFAGVRHVFPLLVLGLGYVFIRSYARFKAAWSLKGLSSSWLPMIFRIFIVLLGTYISVMILVPENLLYLPKNSLPLWIVIMFLYPLLSVVPQEIIYRLHIFEAYKEILPNIYCRFLISAFAFGWAHVIYDTWFPVVSTFFVGLFLSYSYVKAKGSLIPVTIEHAIYGQIVFTLGLGTFFYSGHGL